MRISDWSSDVCSSDLLLQMLLLSSVPTHDAVGATARQFFMDVYHEQLFPQTEPHEGTNGEIEAQERKTPQHCGKRSPDTSPAKESNSCRSVANLARTKHSNSYTQLLQSKMQLGRASGRERVWQYRKK